MVKEQMIQIIFKELKNKAFLEGKVFDESDVFFKIAFISEKNLEKILKLLNKN